MKKILRFFSYPKTYTLWVNIFLVAKNAITFCFMLLFFHIHENFSVLVQFLTFLNIFRYILELSVFLFKACIINKKKNTKKMKMKENIFDRIYKLLFGISAFLEIIFFLNIGFLCKDPNLFRLYPMKMIEYIIRMVMVNIELNCKIMSIFFSLLVFLNYFFWSLNLESDYIILISLEIASIFVLFWKNSSFVLEKLRNEKRQNQEGYNMIEKGFLCISETKKKEYEIKYYNKNFKEFFCLQDHLSFTDLDHKLTNFCFIKYKYIKKRENNENVIEIINENLENTASTSLNINKNAFNSIRSVISFAKSKLKKIPDVDSIVFKFYFKETKESFKVSLKYSEQEKFYSEKAYYFLFKKIKEKKQNSTIMDNKNRIITSFTHELKTPLNGSIPILQEMKDQLKTHPSVLYIDQALASLQLLEVSLNNIIDYSLTLSDQFIVHLTKIDLEELLGEVFHMVSSQVELKKLDFAIEMSEDLLKTTILSDYNRLKQIIINILLNSLQFTYKGSINLVVYKELSNPFLIFFKVSDTGIGIEEDKLNNLKNKLKNGDQNNFQMNSTGSCLGLVMSQNIATLLGNKGIEIESDVNVGTDVLFQIIDQQKEEVFCGGEFQSPATKNSVKTEKSMQHIIFSTKKRKIYEDSREIYSIRQKKMEMQRTVKENSLSALNESEEKIEGLNSSNFDLRLSSMLISHDFQTMNNLKKNRFERTSPKNNKISSLNNLELKIQQYTRCKTIYSFQISSPGLRANTILSISPDDGEEKKCNCEEILIVDDDAFNLFSLEMILKGFHFTVKKALNGKEAIEKLKNHHCESKNCKKGFKLIFLDYQMPVMDGVETATEINILIQNHQVKEIPIIGCTAFTSKDEIKSCLNAGMKDVIFKPLNRNTIGSILKEWL